MSIYRGRKSMTHPIIEDLRWRHTTKKYDATKNGNDINNCKWMKEIFPASVLEIIKK